MTKKKLLNMAKTLNVIMTDENFIAKWKNDPEKKQRRITLTKEALDFASEQAFNDFGMGQSSLSMAVSKLILIAKDCLENQKK